MARQPIVCAVGASLALQETLAILLERDCLLQWLGVGQLERLTHEPPDLVLVSGAQRDSTVERIARRQPALPVIAIEADSTLRSSLANPTVHSVPLDPLAIRSTVQRCLRTLPNTELPDAIASIVGTLRRDLAYPFTALRTFTSHRVTQGGAPAHAIALGVVGEQCAVLAACLAQLAQFQDRPRLLKASADFVDGVCVALQHATTASARAWQCDVRRPHGAQTLAGPATLAPLVAGLVLAHLQQRAAGWSLQVHAEPSGVRITYPLRRAAPTQPESISLRLAALALEPFAWKARVVRHASEETIHLSPIERAQ